MAELHETLAASGDTARAYASTAAAADDIARILWALFDRYRDVRIRRVWRFAVPVPVYVYHLEPALIAFVGPRPRPAP